MKKTNVVRSMLTAIAAKRFSHKEKIGLLICGILLIGGGYYMVDRWIESQKRTFTVAEPIIPVSAGKNAPPKQKAAKAAEPPPTSPAVVPTKKMRDPFLETLNPVKQKKETVVQRPAVTLQVTGILWDEKVPTAIINNKVVGIGATLYGKTVVDIERDQVILMEEGTIEIIKLQKE